MPVITASCHCGDVTVAIPRRPDTVTDCSCSICRRYGVLWAYFARDEVVITSTSGTTAAYAWGPATLRFVRCGRCGCVTHWEPLVPERGSRVGINARNLERADLDGIRIRRLDGAVTERYLD